MQKVEWNPWIFVLIECLGTHPKSHIPNSGKHIWPVDAGHYAILDKSGNNAIRIISLNLILSDVRRIYRFSNNFTIQARKG